MKIHKISQKNLNTAAKAIQNGGLVAFPTETVYGIGALASDDKAITRLYKIKGRPINNPLIVHIHSVNILKSIVEFIPLCAKKLIKDFWPGPLTLIFKYKNIYKISNLARSGLETVAIRIPENTIALSLLKKVNLPIVAPSANISQHLSPTAAIHVQNDLGKRLDPSQDMILDGGKCDLGIESTVIDVTSKEPAILRLGSISKTQINKSLNIKIKKNKTRMMKSPGMMKKHYSPKTKLRLNASNPKQHEVWLGFGKEDIKYKVKSENLSKNGNIQEAAVNLYSMLRKLDTYKAKTIAVAKIPAIGIGEAINDRLKRGS